LNIRLRTSRIDRKAIRTVRKRHSELGASGRKRRQVERSEARGEVTDSENADADDRHCEEGDADLVQEAIDALIVEGYLWCRFDEINTDAIQRAEEEKERNEQEAIKEKNARIIEENVAALANAPVFLQAMGDDSESEVEETVPTESEMDRKVRWAKASLEALIKEKLDSLSCDLNEEQKSELRNWKNQCYLVFNKTKKAALQRTRRKKNEEIFKSTAMLHVVPRAISKLETIGERNILKKGDKFSTRNEVKLHICELFCCRREVPIFKVINASSLVAESQTSELKVTARFDSAGHWTVIAARIPSKEGQMTVIGTSTNVGRGHKACAYSAEQLAGLLTGKIKMKNPSFSFSRCADYLQDYALNFSSSSCSPAELRASCSLARSAWQIALERVYGKQEHNVRKIPALCDWLNQNGHAAEWYDYDLVVMQQVCLKVAEHEHKMKERVE
jgi:hypothetical protein